MLLDLSPRKNAFHFSGHFLASNSPVDAFDSSFFALGHVATLGWHVRDA
jgi:hypothetical protein